MTAETIRLAGRPGRRPRALRGGQAASEGRIDARAFNRKTPDNRPLIGPTTIEGVYVLGALSGFGIMGSQAAADLLAARLVDLPLPAAAFHPARFGDPLYQRILATLDPRSGQL